MGVRNSLRTIRDNVLGTEESKRARKHNKAVADAKAKLDDLARDPNVRRFYMFQSIPYLFDTDAAMRAHYDELCDKYFDPRTHLRDEQRIRQFMALLAIVNQRDEGDYLEIGTFQGGSARLIHKCMDQTRTLFCIDTFEGFVEKDLEEEKLVAPNHNWSVGNFPETSPERVGNYIGDGRKPDNVTLIKGWFPEAFAGLEERRWRFIHIDVDLYEPTRIACEMLWPKLVDGGLMVFHDYENNAFPGMKVAVDEFLEKQGLWALPMGDLWGSAMVMKPGATGAK